MGGAEQGSPPSLLQPSSLAWLPGEQGQEVAGVPSLISSPWHRLALLPVGYHRGHSPLSVPTSPPNLGVFRGSDDNLSGPQRRVGGVETLWTAPSQSCQEASLYLGWFSMSS